MGINSSAKFILYANDTSIFLTDNLPHEVTDHANSTLLRLEKSTKHNGWKRNVKKTKSNLFRGKNKNIAITKTIVLNSVPVVTCLSLRH